MSAELYIESTYNVLQARLQPQFDAAVKRRDAARSTKAREEAQWEVNRLFDEAHPPTAYFRDAYNSHCLLAQLGLSWWHDVAPRLTEDDHLPLQHVQWLLGEVMNRRLSGQSKATYEQQVASEVMARVAGVDATVIVEETYTSEDVQWFVSRKQALITFLKTALDLATPLVCSL